MMWFWILLVARCALLFLALAQSAIGVVNATQKTLTNSEVGTAAVCWALFWALGEIP